MRHRIEEDEVCLSKEAAQPFPDNNPSNKTEKKDEMTVIFVQKGKVVRKEDNRRECPSEEQICLERGKIHSRVYTDRMQNVIKRGMKEIPRE